MNRFPWRHIKGLIFDMDNTLLRSQIDFPGMKRSVFDYLAAERLAAGRWPQDDQTTSTLIAAARDKGMTAEQEQAVWTIAAKYETEGMRGADPEPGAQALLERLHGRYRLVVLTNNAREAAGTALRETGMNAWIDQVVAREQTALKPAPDGVKLILEAYPDISKSEWVAVGDSWIDGKAACEAGVAFVGYGPNQEAFRKRGIRPDAFIRHLDELCDLLALL